MIKGSFLRHWPATVRLWTFPHFLIRRDRIDVQKCAASWQKNKIKMNFSLLGETTQKTVFAHISGESCLAEQRLHFHEERIAAAASSRLIRSGDYPLWRNVIGMSGQGCRWGRHKFGSLNKQLFLFLTVDWCKQQVARVQETFSWLSYQNRQSSSKQSQSSTRRELNMHFVNYKKKTQLTFWTAIILCCKKTLCTLWFANKCELYYHNK